MKKCKNSKLFVDSMFLEIQSSDMSIKLNELNEIYIQFKVNIIYLLHDI